MCTEGLAGLRREWRGKDNILRQHRLRRMREADADAEVGEVFGAQVPGGGRAEFRRFRCGGEILSSLAVAVELSQECRPLFHLRARRQ